jgi:hypothetical protein
MVNRTVAYFNQPGKQNTKATINSVRAYLKEETAVEAVIVASVSGETALKCSQELSGSKVPVICVTAPPSWQNYPEYKYPFITQTMRRKLEKAGVTIVDSIPSGLCDTIDYSFGRYGYRPPLWAFIETLLAVGGYGLKTAIECMLMATDGGYVRPFREVISIAGTGKGADTAIVVNSCFASTAFSNDSKKRLVVKEILAMPRDKKFYKNVIMSSSHLEEVK